MIALRQPEPEDVPMLAALGHDSFVAKFGHLYREEDLAPFLVSLMSSQQLKASPVRAPPMSLLP